MDNLYSSFYLYRKYEIIGDELIDLGITSIDADGTQEPVMKEECDPACGCPEPIYRWVQTEDTVCVGEEPAVQYRWTPSGWTCVGYDKYQNNIKEQSVDEGLTWTVVIPEEYSASTLIESQSTDCGYVPPTPASPKFTLTLSDSSVVSAECDSTSAITSAETSSYYRSSATSVVIGDCVTSIGNGAFMYYESLSSVTIGNNVETIGELAFALALTYLDGIMVEITIPDSVTSIGYGAFAQNLNLISVTVEATTPPTLGSSAFDDTNNCPIYVPCESVEAYKAASGWSTYANRIEGIPPCGQPTPTGAKFTLTLSDSSTVTAECDSTSAVTSGEVATQYSGSVISAEIGDCVNKIETFTFRNCYNLSSITIPDSVTNIGSSVFRNCTGLTSVTIPNSVTAIGGGAFGGCSGLTSIEIPTGVTNIDEVTFENCSGLTSVTISANITNIGMEAFERCSKLKNVTIPNNVATIGQSAFWYCTKLTACTIGTSITNISRWAFYACTSLTSITCLATTPPTLGADVFAYTNSCPIYVPSGSVNAYKSASGWSNYASRIQAIP